MERQLSRLGGTLSAKMSVPQAEASDIRAFAELQETVMRYPQELFGEITRRRPYLWTSFDQGPRKRPQWTSSRLALADSIRSSLAFELAPRQIFCSLSHCSSLSVAASVAVERNSAILGIGIDIEEADRPIAQKVLDRVRARKQVPLPDERIIQWVAKEAAYKSIPENDDVYLSDISIEKRCEEDGLVVFSGQGVGALLEIFVFPRLQMTQHSKRWAIGISLCTQA